MKTCLSEVFVDFVESSALAGTRPTSNCNPVYGVLFVLDKLIRNDLFIDNFVNILKIMRLN